MKKFLLSAAILCSTTLCTAQQTRNLLNGKDFTGWHIDVPAVEKDSSLPIPFIVRNDMLVSLATPQGHIITDAQYENFRLDVEYRFPAKPGNCGVLVFVSTPRVLYDMFPKSIEVQLMHKNAGDFWCIGEDIAVPDMEERRGPKNTWGAVDGKNRRVRNLTDSSEHALGEWNTMRVECLGNTVKVWVNGDLVNDGFNATASKGQIALQAEGSEVEFRKVALTPLKKQKARK